MRGKTTSRTRSELRGDDTSKTPRSSRAQATYQFDLPEQPLADSLRAIAAKVGTNILFDSKDVKDLKAAPAATEGAPIWGSINSAARPTGKQGANFW